MIGLGNLLGGDDAFGLRVIDRLRRHPPDGLDVSQILEGGTDLLGQFDLIANCEFVILVDALLDSHRRYGVPGQIVILGHDALMSMPQNSLTAHHISPLLAVQLFPRLYPRAATRFKVVGFCTDTIAAGPPAWLSEGAVEEADALIRTICVT